MARALTAPPAEPYYFNLALQMQDTKLQIASVFRTPSYFKGDVCLGSEDLSLLTNEENPRFKTVKQ